jgi:sugar lactone lactonase YvrE
MADRTVYRLEKDASDDPRRSVEGKHFNGPNDIVVKSDGAVYTDTV